MSLSRRDRFALGALTGSLANPARHGSLVLQVRHAVQVADMLIAELEKLPERVPDPAEAYGRPADVFDGRQLPEPNATEDSDPTAAPEVRKVHCSYAKSDMSPCVLRDGIAAYGLDSRRREVCMGCGRSSAETGVEWPRQT